MKIQPAVKKETGHIACWSGAGTVLMIVAFAICHKLFPEAVPFDYKVIIGGIIGTAVAVGNFFIMGLTVQKIADMQDQDLAYRRMKTSYHYRTMIQFLWIILAVTVPFINGVAGIIPLFVPGAVIKARGILGTIKTNK